MASGSADGLGHLALAMSRRGASVVTTVFDNEEELLWTGFADGRIECLVSPLLERYAGFRAHDSAVLGIHPVQGGLVSVSSNSIRVHSKGGVLRQQSKYAVLHSLLCMTMYY